MTNPDLAAFVPVEQFNEIVAAQEIRAAAIRKALVRAEAAEARVEVLEDRLRHIANYYPAGHRITELALEALGGEHE